MKLFAQEEMKQREQHMRKLRSKHNMIVRKKEEINKQLFYKLGKFHQNNNLNLMRTF